MQDPNADTEWNAILRAKGILAPKEKEITEEEIVDIVERTIQEKMNKDKYLDKTLDELDEFEDEEDERVLNEYRRKRIEEMKLIQSKAKYGEVYEITAVDYVQEVNKAGDGVWVILHLYKQGVQLCAVLNEHIKHLARKYANVKFIKSISTTCIPNYPDKNLPTLFIYYEGEMRKQLVGSEFNINLKLNDFERMLAFNGVAPIKPENLDDNDDSNLNGNRLKQAENNMLKTIRSGLRTNGSDDDEC